MMEDTKHAKEKCKELCTKVGQWAHNVYKYILFNTYIKKYKSD